MAAKPRSPSRPEERAAHDHRRPGRARPQPEEHLGRDPARPADRRHRALRLGQVEPGVRHDLRRGPAALHGIALELREAVRRAGREARRRLRLRPVARHLDRAEDDRQQSALDRRHDDRHRELPESAVRDDWRAALPAHRRAGAEPHGESDSRSDPVAARRHGGRAARAGLQGLRRGARLRLHRSPEEGLPPDHRRRQADRHLRRTWNWTSRACTHMDAVVDRVIVGREAREGDQGGDRRRRCWSAMACCRSTSLKGVEQGARPTRFYRGACSATHHFVYGDIAPDYFMFNNPESACRTCGGLGVHKLTHPELLVPDPKRSIRGGCFVREALQVQPGHVGRPGDVQPGEGARLLARYALGGSAGNGPRRDPQRHRAARSPSSRRRRRR